LPKAWRRNFTLETEKNLLVIRADTGATGLHVFEIRPQTGGVDGIITSERFVYRYRMEDPNLDPRSVEYAYHRIFSEFRDRESEWAELFPTEDPTPQESPSSEPASDRPPSTVFIQETALYQHVAGQVGHDNVKTALNDFLDGKLEDGPAEVQLYFRNPCVQSCEFCTEPIMRPHVTRITTALNQYHEMGLDLVGMGIFSALLDVLAERDGATSLCVTGNDWTRHPRVEEILKRLEEERKVPIRLIGPHATLSDETLAQRVAKIPMLREIRVSIFSADPAKHDMVTGTPGAGAQIMKAVDNLNACGFKPAVNTVLTRNGVQELPGLVQWVAERDLRLTLLAFVPDVFPDTSKGFKGEWDTEALLAPYSELLKTLAAIPPEQKTAIDSLHGFPLCAVPEDLEPLLRWSGRSEEAEPEIMLAPCTECSARSRCSGVPKTYAEHYGDTGLTPR